MKKAFSVVQKKHHLPTFEALDAEFDISTIESKGKPIKEIIGRMKDRIDRTVNLLQNLIHPSGDTVLELVESNFLSQTDKKEMVHIEKEIMILFREFLVAQYARDEKRDIALIKEVMKKWPSLRKEIVPYLEKIKKGWKERGESTEILEYLG